MADKPIDEGKEKKKKKSSLKPKSTDGDTKKLPKKSTKISEDPEENVDNEIISETNEDVKESTILTDESNPSSRKSSKDIQELSTKSMSKDERSNSTIEKSAMDVINEIFNPTLMEFDAKKPYHVPDAVKPGDVNALQDLDERKLIELKEAFLLFDLDGDGCIDADDLRGTFGTLGEESVSDKLVEEMLSEAMNPLNFDAFVMLLGYKSIELDPEDVLCEALSKWDLTKSGLISEDKIRHDLISYGDRFTEKEATYALELAPIANKNRTPGEPSLIDYPAFCKVLCGLRKRKKGETA